MLAVSAIYTPQPITGQEHQPSLTDRPDASEWPALLQQSLAMWERVFAHQTGAIAPPTLLAPQSPTPATATTDQPQGACAS